RFSSETLKVAYHWPDRLNESNGYSLPMLSKSEQDKIYRYHLFLVQNSRQQHSGKSVEANQTLSQILQPLMQMAAKHSEKNQAPVENRDAILAATFHVLQLPLE